MNKFMAIVFAVGAIGFLGLSQRHDYQTQDHARSGAPVGEVRTVQITSFDKTGYIVLGAVCMAASLYFVAQVRRNDFRR